MQQDLFTVAAAMHKRSVEDKVEDQIEVEERRASRQRYLAMISGFTQSTVWPE